jgi:nicotinamide-nucleotide amidase
MSLAEQVFEVLQCHQLNLATAESCTGGMVAAAITDIAGSSVVFDRGFVTYSNAAKTEMLGVPENLIIEFGAVSAEVAQAMAKGALAHSNANITVAITGIAGPTGGSPNKPVGLVHFAISTAEKTKSAVQHFGNLSRSEIRKLATEFALQFILDELPVRDIRNEEATRFTARTGEP